MSADPRGGARRPATRMAIVAPARTGLRWCDANASPRSSPVDVPGRLLVHHIPRPLIHHMPFPPALASGVPPHRSWWTPCAGRGYIPAMRLAGERVLVTGSTSGIGKHVALLCAREGARVCVHGRNVERGTAVVRAIVE